MNIKNNKQKKKGWHILTLRNTEYIFKLALQLRFLIYYPSIFKIQTLLKNI